MSLTGGLETNDGEGAWLGLDQEIQQLATSLAAEDTLQWKGFIRVRYEQSSDEAFTPSKDSDLSGFRVTNARVAVETTVGDYFVKIQPEFAGSAVSLKDAYVRWGCGEHMKATFGQYKTPFSPRFMRREAAGILIDRTLTAVGDNKALYFDRDVGLMLNGTAGGRFELWGSVQNGGDTRADEYLLTARAQASVMGAGTQATTKEGGYGMADGTALDVGVGFADDGSVEDGDALTVDATLNVNPLSASVAFFDFGEGVGDNTPWDVWLGWMFAAEWEAALRYEDLDDDVADTTATTVGVNWYQGRVDRKWQANVVSVDSDDDAVEGTYVALGLTMGF